MAVRLTGRRGVPAGLRHALPVVVVAIVVGILGMHALGSSHAMEMHDAEHATLARAVPDHSVSDVALAADRVGTVSTLPGALVGAATVNAVGAADHGMGTMMMLCGAMIASAGALLLGIFAWRRRLRIWARLSWTTGHGAGLLRTRIASTRPPPAWEFSVIRC